MEALADTSEVVVPNSYRERLIRSRNVLMKAEYWKIFAESLPEAEAIKNEINEGDLAISFDTYTKVDYKTIDPSDDDFNLVEKALVNTPLLAFSESEGWMVINVIKKDLTEVSNSTTFADIETNYKVFNAITSEVEDLRREAEIKVDTLLFDDIYEVWKQRSEDSNSE